MSIFAVSTITTYKNSHILSIDDKVPLLEVFECTYFNIGDIISVKYRYLYNDGKWVKSMASKTKRFYYDKMSKTIDGSLKHYEESICDNLFVNSLEIAKIIKIILVDKEIKYRPFTQNIDKALNEMINEYPEYFI
jgi:hypothetical protein